MLIGSSFFSCYHFPIQICMCNGILFQKWWDNTALVIDGCLILMMIVVVDAINRSCFPKVYIHQSTLYFGSGPMKALRAHVGFGLIEVAFPVVMLFSVGWFTFDDNSIKTMDCCTGTFQYDQNRHLLHPPSSASTWLSDVVGSGLICPVT